MSVWSNGKSSLLCFGAVVLMTGVAAAKPAYVASTVNFGRRPAPAARSSPRFRAAASSTPQRATAAGARSPGRTRKVLRFRVRST